ncbi:NAD(P)/FAD-dependent oxidoreductase [Microbacterium capsulatum]|uniref:NAD(P)/FAD-dependent oxidoreductase n=1 Tax=Microbacterium capsulatum TaxID=3041921 RepID=A0ABU0XL09_9MICO|nr:NAD(P)/FAD-dependent oxidoreductase [Microbacterium sp. ASV81]MDQ4215803.1 NAD(P)/FAD-dependent oxidoreductase [Microbacterium sp. ASV81]
MSTAALDLAIIGAGAAGLHTARRAQQHGATFEVFDAHARIGDTWRERYRSLRLFTPRRWAELPGLGLDIGYFEYATGMQLADYLERYAATFEIPVRTSTPVQRLSLDPSGLFRLELPDGEEVLAERVVVAAGAHHRPIVPALAAEIDPTIRQVHSLDYHGPEDLAAGAVLVVGAANSGTDIALEAAAAGHRTTIAGRNPGQIPGHIDTPVGNLISSIFIRRLRNATSDTEKGRRMWDERKGHGVNLVRNHVSDLIKAGIRQVGRVVAVDDGLPTLEDGERLDPATIVWCTGSRPVLGWIDIPGFADREGVRHDRGISTTVPGLAFVGLPFQYSIASPTLMGMGRDAEYVVEQLFPAMRALQAA